MGAGDKHFGRDTIGNPADAARHKSCGALLKVCLHKVGVFVGQDPSPPFVASVPSTLEMATSCKVLQRLHTQRVVCQIVY